MAVLTQVLQGVTPRPIAGRGKPASLPHQISGYDGDVVWVNSAGSNGSAASAAAQQQEGAQRVRWSSFYVANVMHPYADPLVTYLSVQFQHR